MTGAPSASAQNGSSSYWQYAASTRLDSVELADINRDGVDELLVLDESGRLSLLSAAGQQAWSFLSPNPVSAVGAVDVFGGPELEIVLAGSSDLALLDSDGDELWRIPIVAATNPAAIAAYDYQADGRDEILILLGSGTLLVYDGAGNQVWQFAGQDDATANANPRMLVADFDQDGFNEIALSVFTPRRFSQLLYLDDGVEQWRQSISRRITTLAEAPFGPGIDIAVGTNFGQIDLYTADGERVWFRTVNRPVTALAFAELAQGPSLAVGTASGSVVAFSREGRRLWASNLAQDADRQLLALLPAGGSASIVPTPLAAILEPISESSELADVLLLGNNGQTLAKLNDTDLPDLTRLIDVNRDGHYELLLARFATLQLIGLGIGDSEYVQEWQYALDASPTAILVTDLDEDDEDEVVIGTRDGRLHSLSVDHTIRWLNAPGEEIAFLGRVRYSLSDPPRIAVVRRQRAAEDAPAGEPRAASWLELRESSGERLWEIVLPGEVTALAIDDFAGVAQPSILIGAHDGHVGAYDFDGKPLWQYDLPELEGGVRQLIVYGHGSETPDQVLVVGAQDLYALTPSGDSVFAMHLASYAQPVHVVFAVHQSDTRELAVRLVVLLEDGAVHALNWRGIEMGQWKWPIQLNGRPTAVDASGDGAIEAFQENVTAFLVATDSGSLEQLTVVDGQPATPWQLDGLGLVQAVDWDDLDKDGQPETGLVGTRDGDLWLYQQLHTRTPRRVLDLPLASGVFSVSLLKRASSQSPDLLAITQNGLLRLYREEENRPPLLTQPTVEAEQGQSAGVYTIGVVVKDVESDTVAVRLELQDASGEWQPAGEQQLASGNGPLFWPTVNVPMDADQVRYRFRYSDGFYSGYLTPPDGPEVVAGPLTNRLAPVLFAVVGMVAAVGVVGFVRQSRTPAAQAGRFHRRLAQQPEETLSLLEQRYQSVNGSPDFLLQLANRARQAGDSNVANLADGLFLLPNRPQAGLSIITRTLDDSAAAGSPWAGLSRQRSTYRMCQALLEAPSITELALLRPQLVHLINTDEQRWPFLESLLPVMTNMRDSERVDSVEDRLVYLNQAVVRLRQVQDQLAESEPSIERTLVRAIGRRWSGLLSAEIEEQRGRAELEMSLKTKRLAPNGQTHVALEIRNTGRAAAENVVATLDENPAYRVHSAPQVIPFLPSGRSREVRFLIEPQAEARFRVGLSLTYDDRNRREKTAAFGDMVYLLPPVREYTPIANPYLPGTPLRKDNPLFVGREELFNFIAEHNSAPIVTNGAPALRNAPEQGSGGNGEPGEKLNGRGPGDGMQTQRNVLMLVGQRRTGKTSILLRLEEYLPAQILPVYIDCQSLGVSPGMPSLLQEFAWHIADTLGARDLVCPVPEFAAWQADPTRVFQREFLPAVRALMPAGSTLLLVFDEFEAFESMVADGILPRTFFPYMRHLMQHSPGLGFLFVGTRRLEEMSADYWSVLFNIALYRKIDFLSEAAAIRLIGEPVAPHIIYDDLAIDKILRVTAGHPYFLQLVCYTLVKQANQQKTGYVTISDVNVALDEMLRLGEVHFAYLWQRSSHSERAVLAAAAHLMDRNEPLHPEAFIDYLRSYSIELDPTEATNALNLLVARDIMREVTEEGKALYELRIGLVGLWVAQNKSLSKLLAHPE